jgi:hypothetical protein
MASSDKYNLTKEQIDIVNKYYKAFKEYEQLYRMNMDIDEYLEGNIELEELQKYDIYNNSSAVKKSKSISKSLELRSQKRDSLAFNFTKDMFDYLSELCYKGKDRFLFEDLSEMYDFYDFNENHTSTFSYNIQNYPDKEFRIGDEVYYQGSKEKVVGYDIDFKSEENKWLYKISNYGESIPASELSLEKGIVVVNDTEIKKQKEIVQKVDQKYQVGDTVIHLGKGGKFYEIYKVVPSSDGEDFLIYGRDKKGSGDAFEAFQSNSSIFLKESKDKILSNKDLMNNIIFETLKKKKYEVYNKSNSVYDVQARKIILEFDKLLNTKTGARKFFRALEEFSQKELDFDIVFFIPKNKDPRDLEYAEVVNDNHFDSVQMMFAIDVEYANLVRFKTENGVIFKVVASPEFYLWRGIDVQDAYDPINNRVKDSVKEQIAKRLNKELSFDENRESKRLSKDKVKSLNVLDIIEVESSHVNPYASELGLSDPNRTKYLVVSNMREAVEIIAVDESKKTISFKDDARFSFNLMDEKEVSEELKMISFEKLDIVAPKKALNYVYAHYFKFEEAKKLTNYKYKDLKKEINLDLELSPNKKLFEVLKGSMKKKNSLMPAMEMVNFDSYGLTVTNAYSLIHISSKIKKYEGVYNDLGVRERNSEGNYYVYPDWYNVFDVEKLKQFEVNILELYNYLLLIKELRLFHSDNSYKTVAVNIEGDRFGINLDVALGFLKSFISVAGDQNIYAYYVAPNRSIQFTNRKVDVPKDEIGKDGFIVGMLMPVVLTKYEEQIENAFSEDMLKPSKYGAWDMDFERFFSSYFDFDKNSIIDENGNVVTLDPNIPKAFFGAKKKEKEIIIEDNRTAPKYKFPEAVSLINLDKYPDIKEGEKLRIHHAHEWLEGQKEWIYAIDTPLSKEYIYAFESDIIPYQAKKQAVMKNEWPSGYPKETYNGVKPQSGGKYPLSGREYALKFIRNNRNKLFLHVHYDYDGNIVKDPSIVIMKDTRDSPKPSLKYIREDNTKNMQSIHFVTYTAEPDGLHVQDIPNDVIESFHYLDQDPKLEIGERMQEVLRSIKKSIEKRDSDDDLKIARAKALAKAKAIRIRIRLRKRKSNQ